ncbi:SDR family oxidoreductase [Paenibacillus mesophilus]|nr:SDR family oxidoreductase [Paenibacillus mesophilus]
MPVNVLITGSNGFIGRHMVDRLQKREDVRIATFTRGDDLESLETKVKEADVIFHLAGVNRPQNEAEFEEVNAGLTEYMAALLLKHRRAPTVVMSSSIQAESQNAYGRSKKQAEEAMLAFALESGANVCVYRLPNVFGKWCKPNYNSVVATYCHNIARGLDITISDPEKGLTLVYIDDVIDHFIDRMDTLGKPMSHPYYSLDRTFQIKLGELADKIYRIRDIRKSHILPDLSEPLMKCLYTTYLSYLNKQDFAYRLEMKTDHRGSLAEVIKSNQFGQIFISKSHKGVVRGNHYHHTKVEKFCVIQGEAIIRFRHVHDGEVLNYQVSGERIEVVDIPPGYTHSIENVSDGELTVLFWANEIFDPQAPDTYYLEV